MTPQQTGLRLWWGSDQLLSGHRLLKDDAHSAPVFSREDFSATVWMTREVQ
jgi:hypothetical protein